MQIPQSSAVPEADGGKRLAKAAIPQVLRDMPGYENIPVKDYDYVLNEAGFAKRADLDLDEFIQVSFAARHNQSIICRVGD
jgi:glycerol-3-phosphate dehydrogenase